MTALRIDRLLGWLSAGGRERPVRGYVFRTARLWVVCAPATTVRVEVQQSGKDVASAVHLFLFASELRGPQPLPHLTRPSIPVAPCTVQRPARDPRPGVLREPPAVPRGRHRQALCSRQRNSWRPRFPHSGGGGGGGGGGGAAARPESRRRLVRRPREGARRSRRPAEARRDHVPARREPCPPGGGGVGGGGRGRCGRGDGRAVSAGPLAPALGVPGELEGVFVRWLCFCLSWCRAVERSQVFLWDESGSDAQCAFVQLCTRCCCGRHVVLESVFSTTAVFRTHKMSCTVVTQRTATSTRSRSELYLFERSELSNSHQVAPQYRACVKQKELRVCTLKLAFRVLGLILDYRGGRTMKQTEKKNAGAGRRTPTAGNTHTADNTGIAGDNIRIFCCRVGF